MPTPYDRTARLAAVLAAWTPLRYFYPYFDVVDVDWDAALATALTQAAVDPDPAAFTSTLQRLIAALDDGHGQIVSPYRPPQGFLPLVWDWVEDQMVITTVTDGGVSGLAPGDRVLAIDGVAAEAALAAETWPTPTGLSSTSVREPRDPRPSPRRSGDLCVVVHP